ncbi:uncharacterized protein DUF1524 [Litorimonas taeanensis]|uniref:Uncharacterized protein DUF1524 n=1 Tax=Litorimonas taeanensis TaxID=568099 RepID=A0A420WD06_9PROT|nr:DUF262 domain-containing protein [Litorimonas taeanensis]RKQ68863.1 uncharacterized protein DUF1524 [Litorimonas taeanensis]
MNDPKTKTVGEIFTTQTQLTIPKYQRGYDWKYDKQVTELFSDIEDCIRAKGKKKLFLGTTILDISGAESDKIEIIDGQQRTTTLLILLIALRSYAKNVLSDDESVDFLHEFIVWKKPFSRKPQVNRFAPSPQIENIFNYMSKKNWDGNFPPKVNNIAGTKEIGVKLENNRVRPVYNALYQKIVNYCEDDPIDNFEILCNQIVYETYIIQIEIEDKSEAFEIFERTNARGKTLEISDLLKNYLFSKYPSEEVVRIEKIWYKISKNAGSSMLRMLKYFWVSRKSLVPNRELYSELREYARKKGVTKFTQDILDFSEFYAAFNSKKRGEFQSWIESETDFPENSMYVNEIVRIRNAFRLFGITQVTPVIFSSIQKFSESSSLHSKTRRYINFLRYLEGYHFVNNKVCNRIGNEVEKLYGEYGKAFLDTDNFFETCDDLMKLLNKQKVKEDEFVTSFEYLTYGKKTEGPFIRYIFDRIVNIGVRQSNRIMLFDYFDKRPGYDIDHLLCQKEAKTTVSETTMHELGNLLVIPNQINSILNDDNFEVKIKKFKDPLKYGGKINHTPDYVKSFALQYENKQKFTTKDINERTKKLAKLAYSSATDKVNY